MLGFAPLAALPLAATGNALVAILVQVSATGGITFAGAPALDFFTRTPMTSSGGVRFSGHGAITPWVYASSTGGIIFNGRPRLRVAGRPIIITALPDSFTIRAEIDNYTITALPQSFEIRGVPE